MEYLVAALALLLAAGYGVLVAVNIEKGKEWALETAQAISLLDPHPATFEVRAKAMETAPEVVEPEEVAEPESIDRLAA